MLCEGGKGSCPVAYLGEESRDLELRDVLHRSLGGTREVHHTSELVSRTARTALAWKAEGGPLGALGGTIWLDMFAPCPRGWELLRDGSVLRWACSGGKGIRRTGLAQTVEILGGSRWQRHGGGQRGAAAVFVLACLLAAGGSGGGGLGRALGSGRLGSGSGGSGHRAGAADGGLLVGGRGGSRRRRVGQAR